MMLILSILAVISAYRFRKRTPAGIGQGTEHESEKGATP
jgi:hypothetical protein